MGRSDHTRIVQDYQHRLLGALIDVTRDHRRFLIPMILMRNLRMTKHFRNVTRNTILQNVRQTAAEPNTMACFGKNYRLVVNRYNQDVNFALIQAGFDPIDTLAHPLELNSAGIYDNRYIALLDEYSRELNLLSLPNSEEQRFREELSLLIDKFGRKNQPETTGQFECGQVYDGIGPHQDRGSRPSGIPRHPLAERWEPLKTGHAINRPRAVATMTGVQVLGSVSVPRDPLPRSSPNADRHLRHRLTGRRF